MRLVGWLALGVTAGSVGACTAPVSSGKETYSTPVIAEDDSADFFTRNTTILGVLGVNDGKSGKFSAAGYHGYLFTGVAGSELTFTLSSPDADPVLIVYGPKTNASWNRARAIAWNDDSGGSTNSTVHLNVTRPGTYLAVAAEYYGRAGGRYDVGSSCDSGNCTKFCAPESDECGIGSFCKLPRCGPTERCAPICAPVDPTRACETNADCATINTSCCCPRSEAVNASYADRLTPECGESTICPAVACRWEPPAVPECVENRCELSTLPSPCEAAGGTCLPGLSICGEGTIATATSCGHTWIEMTCCEPAPRPPFCGGIAAFMCPEGLTCIDDPDDDCDPAHGGADCGGICVERPPVTCVRGGCSGQLCVEDTGEPVASTCEWRAEYACYRGASCEQQDDGSCGWTQTPELLQCIEDARRPDCRTEGCAAGQRCNLCWGRYACLPYGAVC